MQRRIWEKQVPAAIEGEVLPFYFRPAPQQDLPLPSGVAMIRAAEFGKLKLPPGWGEWADAVEM